MKILNLDKVIQPDRKIILDGVEYLIPGSIPVRYALVLSAMLKRIQNDPGDTEAQLEIIDTLHSIFSIKNKVDKNYFLDHIDMDYFTAIISFIFNSGKEEEPVKIEEKKTPENT